MSQQFLNDNLQIEGYIEKMICLKTIDLRLVNPYISQKDVVSYLTKLILTNKQINDVSDAAYYIFNIKINRMIEFLNNEKITDRDITLEDFKDLFIK